MQGDIILKDFYEIDIRSLTRSLPIITVYYNTTDYPDKYIARLFNPTVNPPTPLPYITMANTLEEIEATIPWDMSPVGRQDNDDIVIVGSWI